MATRKSFDKERWEAMTGMEMSQLLPECENPESAGEVTDHAGNEILPTVTEQSGIQEPAEKDGSALHPSAGLVAGNAGCHWKSTAAHSCRFPE